MLNEIISVGVIKFDISDHHPTIITLKTKTQRKDIARPLVRKIQTNKIEKFVEELDKNFQKHFRDDLMHKNINVLISCVKTVTDNIFPKTRVSRKQFKIAKKPWITKDILKALKRQNKLYSKYLKSKKESDYQTYRTFRNEVTRMKESSKAKHYQNLVGNGSDVSMTWKAINQILRKDRKNASSSLPTSIKLNNKVFSKPTKICNALNQHFCKIGHKMANCINTRCANTQPKRFFGKCVLNSLYLEPTDVYEVTDIISTLNPHKSPGIDDIPTKLIKAAKYVLSPYLSKLINYCLKNGRYFDELKIARVTPLHKGGSKFDLQNYRPISVLTSFNKIFETIIKKRLLKFWNKYNVFTANQFGFRENYSTTLAVTQFCEYIRNETDQNNNVCAIFMDLAKAFDTVNHEILLSKLEQYGIRGLANKVIRDYLTNRKQYVHVNGVSSLLENINIGVPQGSVLGPILFLNYINDIVDCSNFNVTLYADDSVLTLAHKNLSTLQSNLNIEIPKINSWLIANQLSLNISKTKFLYFGKSKQKLEINIQSSKINQTDCIKYLGVYLDDKLKWHKHIDYIESKLSAATGALYNLRKFVTQIVLISVYYSLVYSYLQYSVICWGNTTKTLLHKLQVKQNHIVRILSRKLKRKTKLKPLYEKFKFLNVEGVFKLEIAKIMMKLNTNKLPDIFTKNFAKVASVHSHFTRSSSSNDYYVPRSFYVKTNQSIRITGAKIWNDLPSELKDKVGSVSYRLMSKQLKEHLLQQML